MTSGSGWLGIGAESTPWRPVLPNVSSTTTPDRPAAQTTAGFVENRGVQGQDRPNAVNMLSFERDFYAREAERWRNESLSLRVAAETTAARVPSRMVDDDMIPTYDPDDSAGLWPLEWIQRVEQIAAAYEWPGQLLLSRAVTRLRGTARGWFMATAEPLTEWTRFRTEFLEAFPVEIDLVRIHAELAAKTKSKSQSCKSYVYEMAALGRRGRIDEATIVRYILRGVDERMRNSLAAVDIRTVKELVRGMNRAETLWQELPGGKRQTTRDRVDSQAAARRVSHKSSAGPRSPAPATATTNVAQSPSRRERPRSPNEYLRCYYCHAMGHLKRDCPQRLGARSETERAPILLAAERDSAADSAKAYVRRVRIADQEVNALIDTGADSCLMRQSVAAKLRLTAVVANRDFYGLGAAEPVRSTASAKVNVTIDDVTVSDVEVDVVPDEVLSPDMLVGRSLLDRPEVAFYKVGDQFSIVAAQPNLLTKWKGALSTAQNIEPYEDLIREQEQPIENPMVSAVQATIAPRELQLATVTVADRTIEIPVFNPTQEEITIEPGVVLAATKADEAGEDLPENVVSIGSTVSEAERTELRSLIRRYEHVFATATRELGCTGLLEMNIEERPGSAPVASRPYQASRQDREEMRKIIEEWERLGIVKKSLSPYSSPALLVRKKNGESRLVVDFRRLNSQTVQSPYPTPTIDDQLSRLAGNTVFATLDLAQGYLQVPLSESAQPKTAFVTPDYKGQFTRMIFGLTNAPFVFVRLMDAALGDLKNHVVLCYIDDMIVPAKDWSQLMLRLEHVFEALSKAGLTLRSSKCQFGASEFEFLGFVIKDGSMRPGRSKVRAIEEFPEPRNVHEVRRFLGLVGFFRRFIPKFAEKAIPLTQLTRKGVEFAWDQTQKQAFQLLRGELVKEPTLALFDPQAPTELHTDASSEGLAGLLLQRDDQGRLKLVQCVSKRTTNAERHYHASRLELMAVVWSLERFRNLILGMHVTVVTDCQCLSYLHSNRAKNPQLARWSLLLMDYDIDIKHRGGDKMAHADALSRAPVEESADTWSETVSKRYDIFVTLSEDEYVLMIQRSDEALNRLIKILRKDEAERDRDERSLVDKYSLVDGKLCRQVNGTEDLRYVVPKSMRKSLAVKFHDQAGHFSVDRTMALISERYWFGRMRNYLKNHIARCAECLLTKVPGGRQPGKLHPIPPGKRPFETVHLDHVGPFVTTERGNRHILVSVDDLTKYVRAWPTASTTADELMEKMDEFVREFGLPERIVSDRGTCYTSQKFEEYCRQRGVQLILNSSRHPRANGQVERVHRTLVPALQARLAERPDEDWDLVLSLVVRDLNAAQNKTTGRSPFRLLYGYQPSYEDGLIRRLAPNAEQYVDPAERSERQEARDRALQEHVRWCAHHDRHRGIAPVYEVGEVVFMRRASAATGESTKLQAKYRGPLVITEVMPADTYRVCQLEVNSKGRVFATTAHVSALKSCRTKRSAREDDSEIDDSGSDGEIADQDENIVDGAADEEESTPASAESEEAGQRRQMSPRQGRRSSCATERPRRQVRMPRRYDDYQMDDVARSEDAADRQDGRC